MPGSPPVGQSEATAKENVKVDNLKLELLYYITLHIVVWAPWDSIRLFLAGLFKSNSVFKSIYSLHHTIISTALLIGRNEGLPP